jgi:site-specific recombinase XerD
LPRRWRGPDQVAFLSWPKDAKKLPKVMSEEQVSRLLDALESPKYRVFFTTLYATGLRLREASHLEVGGAVEQSHHQSLGDHPVVRSIDGRSAESQTSNGLLAECTS